MTTNTTTHPYRDANPYPVCAVCDALAHLRCPRCKRPFCIDHAAMGPCCEDCARSSARKGDRVILTSLASCTVLVGGLSSYLFMLDSALGMISGVAGMLGGFLISAVARKIARGRAGGWEPVEETALRVGRDAGPEREHRDLVVGRSRLSHFQTSMGRYPL